MVQLIEKESKEMSKAWRLKVGIPGLWPFECSVSSFIHLFSHASNLTECQIPVLFSHSVRSSLTK